MILRVVCLAMLLAVPPHGLSAPPNSLDEKIWARFPHEESWQEFVRRLAWEAGYSVKFQVPSEDGSLSMDLFDMQSRRELLKFILGSYGLKMTIRKKVILVHR